MRAGRKSALALMLAISVTGGALWAADAGTATAPEEQLRGDALPAHAIWMDTLEVGLIDQGFSRPRAKQSVDRKPITLHGDVYRHGVGSHAPGEVRIALNGTVTRFVSAVGIDDETDGKGAAKLTVSVDGKQVQEVEVKGGGEAA